MFSPNAGKCGPEKLRIWTFFYAVLKVFRVKSNKKARRTKPWSSGLKVFYRIDALGHNGVT